MTLPVVWAPGRVNLIGEHTDYSGGLVLPAAIQLGITLTVTRPEEDVRLVSATYGSADVFTADGSGPQVTGWGRYGQAVAAELAALGLRLAGFDATVDSDLPAGSGLSSSAALEVAVGLALCALASEEVDRVELALACQRAELRAVGVPCGILDQAACLLGREGAALLLDCSTLEHRVVHLPEGVALLLVHSGVERSLESSAYGERRAQLEHALRLVGAERSPDVTAADLEQLEGVSLRRLRHVVGENGRVLRFADALAESDLAAAGLLLLESHASLRDDYEVSIPELDLLVELLANAGAYGARLHGGGFGGAVLALVDANHADEIATRTERDYRGRTGRAARSLTALPSRGARVVWEGPEELSGRSTNEKL
jgi:galactokinase